MKHLLLLSLFASAALSASAQNYQIIKSHEQRIYESYSQTIGLEVRSVDFDGDSIFWLAPHWINEAQFAECIYADSSSGLGRYLRIASDGVTTFYTFADEAITLHTQANVGDEPWVAYTAPDASWYLESFVSARVLENVLGSSDSVKTFSFNAFNADGTLTDQWITNESIRIGKQMGLIQSPHIGIFPEFTSTYGAYGFNQLAGIEGQAGLQNLKWFEVYDFEVEDEIHMEKVVFNYGEGFVEHILFNYLSRQDFPDSIVYEVEVSRWYFQGNIADINMQYQGTVIENQTIKNRPGFDALPASPVIDEYDGGWGSSGAYFQLDTYENIPAKYMPRGGHMYYSAFDNSPGCYTEGIDWGCWSGEHAYYVKGLGGPYSQCNSGAPSWTHIKLMYFKKSGEEWGSPLSTASSERLSANALSVYPNPTNAAFRLALSADHYPLQLQIFDLKGREISSQQLMGADAEISTDALSSGLHILHVRAKGSNIYHGKLMVNR